MTNDTPPSAPDAPDIAALTASLMPGGHNLFRQIFQDQGVAAPFILWNPGPGDFQNPLITRFATAMRALTDGDGHVRLRDFDMDDFAHFHDWMLLLDVEGAADSFRYRHYGEGIANVRGLSMLGQTTESFGGHISQFFQAVYCAAARRRDWVLTVHEPPKQIFARNWQRLIVPLLDDDDAVARFAVLNVPDNELRPGLEIIPDPVLITDEAQIVRFANRAAREMFDRQIYLGSDMDLFTFAGIDIDIPASPAQLAQSGRIHDLISIVLRGTMIQRYLLTVSGTEQWGHAFYVFTLHPGFENDAGA